MMKIFSVVLLFMVFMGTQSCGSHCGGPDGGLVNVFTNRGTFIQVNWKNRVPRYVYYPEFNKTDSIFLVAVKERNTNRPISWIHGLYLNSKANSTTAIIRYDIGEDTFSFNYTCSILFTETECKEEFQIAAREVSLGYTTGDSVLWFNSQLYLP